MADCQQSFGNWYMFIYFDGHKLFYLISDIWLFLSYSGLYLAFLKKLTYQIEWLPTLLILFHIWETAQKKSVGDDWTNFLSIIFKAVEWTQLVIPENFLQVWGATLDLRHCLLAICCCVLLNSCSSHLGMKTSLPLRKTFGAFLWSSFNAKVPFSFDETAVSATSTMISLTATIMYKHDVAYSS